MERKYKLIHNDYHGVFCDSRRTSFDEIINDIQELKQSYLEHEFLYKRKVEVSIHYGRINVKVLRSETDKEYNSRIKRSDKATAAAAARSQKAKEKKLQQKIIEFKKLHQQLSVDIPNIVEELINKN